VYKAFRPEACFDAHDAQDFCLVRPFALISGFNPLTPFTGAVNLPDLDIVLDELTLYALESHRLDIDLVVMFASSSLSSACAGVKKDDSSSPEAEYAAGESEWTLSGDDRARSMKIRPSLRWRLARRRFYFFLLQIIFTGGTLLLESGLIVIDLRQRKRLAGLCRFGDLASKDNWIAHPCGNVDLLRCRHSVESTQSGSQNGLNLE